MPTWDHPDHLRLRMLCLMDKYLEGVTEEEPPVKYADGPQWWVFTYDSQPDAHTKPFGEHSMARTIILDTNDDGYFVSLHAKFSLWGCNEGDEYQLDGLAMLGGDDDNFVVIPTELVA